jgi:hypothetical protein
MPDTSAETQIATTFMRLGTWDDEPAEPLMDRYDQLDDVLGTTASAFLGITLRCARCHNHKFEPFTQKDYYHMLAVFEPLKRPQRNRDDLDREIGSAAELKVYRDCLDRVKTQTAMVEKQLAALKESIRVRIAAVKKQPTGVPPQAMSAFQTAPAQRTAEQQKLVKKFALQFEALILEAASAEETAQFDSGKKKIARIKASGPRELPRAYIWYEDTPKAPITHILRRGDPTKPLASVAPGFPKVLIDKEPAPPKPLAKSTGRRLWLARWLTRLDNPLTARVMVNRIWQHYFGVGLVKTANDFGVVSDPPSHPDLLDWLAAEFMAGGWRMKRIHRLIVLSRTYQLAAQHDPAAARVDPDVHLLWRWRQRRLEAEAVRDSILAVSGRLNPQMAGPSVYPPIPRAVLEGQSRPGQGWGKSDKHQASRRSIYIYVKRVLAVPELELLDAPDTTCSCERRPVSTTAPQALTFLNGGFIQQQAGYFAERLRREAGSDPKAQVLKAFELALGRPPRPEELRVCLTFLDAHRKQIEVDTPQSKRTAGDAGRKALQGFCLVILNTNEFVYLN